MQADIAIIGAGPAGLCLARSLSGQGLSIVLVERQARAALADPAEDGREIALTHASRGQLEKLGLWARIAAEDIAPLRDAQVLNGPSLFALRIEAGMAGAGQLGYLVPNQAIRRAAYAAVADCADVSLIEQRSLQAVQLGPERVRLSLSGDEVIHARLLVAADSRFSETRRLLGIGARMEDFGKTMLVCRMAHQQPHRQVAWEWFGYGQTLALLPLNGEQSSVVLTLPPREMAPLLQLDEEAFARDIERRFERRLGSMRLLGARHAYPLVGVFADRFAGPRSALIGDAAVGMHPVTAHGFNFGLQSQRRLAAEILAAQRRGEDIGGAAVLRRYALAQRLASWPLYQATSLIAGLYNDARPPARLLRNAGLRLAQSLPPLRQAIARHLTQNA
ncbi:5-demethoxyubiquinol-8 5-hydroxylase UbiM [Pseudomonas panipatensis]|uniref:Ubiquinone biosynthesis hydroxylase, UbiH/UbiF/VisC/COQ6 family n=1 Tax=Pseudomonas panipatensis TaxID=428992 RepID=A0A1G8ILF8_9PSED|nr:5-demethoxyubiquinol-8 5-hydroxylase UbiM [Pseudomonas panipatensis]SDI19350.1 Ubiquinone biosynthesis hydroxylase, UbiH/UbiF/VisC/COQ6 family [Pseudomonas panipatensis]SMP73687.1 2-octaprenyl-3-methyl-6-methoxy-1,4-benzoquinol hydroxylase [Pseudomonas panipatensis]